MGAFELHFLDFKRLSRSEISIYVCIYWSVEEICYGFDFLYMHASRLCSSVTPGHWKFYGQFVKGADKRISYTFNSIVIKITMFLHFILFYLLPLKILENVPIKISFDLLIIINLIEKYPQNHVLFIYFSKFNKYLRRLKDINICQSISIATILQRSLLCCPYCKFLIILHVCFKETQCHWSFSCDNKYEILKFILESLFFFMTNVAGSKIIF